MNSQLVSHPTPAPVRRQQQVRAVDDEVVRAEADHERLHQAWLALGKGNGNEVALAMVGADMERANRLLQSLSGARKPTAAHRRSHGPERRANQIVEEIA